MEKVFGNALLHEPTVLARETACWGIVFDSASTPLGYLHDSRCLWDPFYKNKT